MGKKRRMERKTIELANTFGMLPMNLQNRLRILNLINLTYFIKQFSGKYEYSADT